MSWLAVSVRNEGGGKCTVVFAILTQSQSDQFEIVLATHEFGCKRADGLTRWHEPPGNANQEYDGDNS